MKCGYHYLIILVGSFIKLQEVCRQFAKVEPFVVLEQLGSHMWLMWGAAFVVMSYLPWQVLRKWRWLGGRQKELGEVLLLFVLWCGEDSGLAEKWHRVCTGIR